MTKKKPGPKGSKGPITREMTLGELVQRFPEAAMLLAEKGLHCIGCHMSGMETVEQGCRAHGMSEEDIDKLVEDMNARARDKNKNKA